MPDNQYKSRVVARIEAYWGKLDHDTAALEQYRQGLITYEEYLALTGYRSYLKPVM